MNALFASRVASLVFLPNLIWLILYLIMPSQNLNVLEDGVLVCTAFGVMTAFSPSAWRIVQGKDSLNVAGWLTLGIWATWFSCVLAVVWSAGWRLSGHGTSFGEGGLRAYFRFAAIYGAVCHLLAPGAINGQVPQRRFMALGAFIAGVMLVCLLVIYAANIETEVMTWWGNPHDSTKLPSPGLASLPAHDVRFGPPEGK